MFLVADGMGGGVSGQVASATALEKLNALTTVTTRTRDDIDECLLQAQKEVRDLGLAQNAVSGTTLTGLILKDLTTLDSDKNSWYIVNVGDSRTYHLNADGHGGWDAQSFLQITHDHSERQEAIDSGRLLPDMANRLVPRNIITQAVGSPSGIAPDYFQADLTGRFVVCSDGIHSELTDDQISTIVSQSDSPSDISHALVDAAMAQGGHDNITVIVVDVDTADTDASAEDAADDATLDPHSDAAGATISDTATTAAIPATSRKLAPTPADSWSMSVIGPGEDIDSMNDSTLETLRTTRAQGETSEDSRSPQA
jgi:serine/threonine protein phosphatase PrpC